VEQFAQSNNISYDIYVYRLSKKNDYLKFLIQFNIKHQVTLTALHYGMHYSLLCCCKSRYAYRKSAYVLCIIKYYAYYGLLCVREFWIDVFDDIQ